MLSAGEQLGVYTLIEPQGGHGARELWLARAPTGDQVLLTVGRVKSASREGRVRDRLQAAFELARALDHPNLVRVLDVGVQGGHHFVAAERLEGVLLSRLLEARPGVAPFPPFLSAYLVLQLAQAMAYLQSQRRADGRPLSLAREIAPATILIAKNGSVKLAELVAATETQDLVETAGQEELGVAAYLSPEVARSGPRDLRSEVFAVGAVFWELLSGTPLFQRGSDLASLAAASSGDIPPLPAGLPPALLRIVGRALSRAPEERYPSAQGLVEALEGALYGRVDVGPAPLAAAIEPFLPVASPRRTAMLSDVEQSGRPRRVSHVNTVPSEPPIAVAEAAAAAAASEAPHLTEQSDPPSGAIRAGAAMRSTKPSDPFFDPSRDAGTISNPRFQVLGRLGAGGMGEVYRVKDQELNEIVALKVIPQHAAGDVQSLERLRREVRLARRISSDHVCRIFDIVDLGDGGRGLTMALVRGVTLAELMKGGLTLDYARFARWGAEVADGLGAAHGLSIVHRDLKPENIMIREDDQAVVLDFGIARTAADAPDPTDGKLTQAGIIMGTPLYMSPEQLTNRPLDGRSDLYALGLILAELITGEVPLRGEGYGQILEERVLKATAFRVRDSDPNVPEALAEVVDALLKAAAQDRPATATSVSQQLFAVAGGRMGSALQSGESVPKGTATPDRPQPRSSSVRSPSRGPSRARPPRPKAGLYLGIGLVVAALLGAGAWWNSRSHPIAAPLPPKVPVLEPLPPPEDAGLEVEEEVPDSGPRKKHVVPPAEEM